MGFEGENVIVEGGILLPDTIREAPDQVKPIIDFLVVDYTFVYNMIMRRPFLNSINSNLSTYALTKKFALGSRVDTVRGEHRTTRESNALAVKSISLKAGDSSNLTGKHKN